jgi:hypothetical protein
VKRMQKIVILAAVLAAPLLTAATSHAEAHCPWLNAATAGWLLDGEVKISVTPPTPQGDATCDFSSGPASAISTLHIAIHTMNSPSQDFASLLAQCGGTRLPLRAIGTDAVQCIGASGSSAGEEEVIARVRERAFILTVHRGGTASPAPKDGLRDDIRNIAEQVAGSLF